MTHAVEEERREILEAGCDDFIRKPYRDTDIFEALAKHLGVRFLYADEQVDDQHCLEVAGMISDHNYELGERLRCMVEDLKYKEMLAVLDNLAREESK